jgi:hypothetical protein
MKSHPVAIIRAQMLHAAASGFTVDHGIVHLNRSQPTSRLSINQILPPQMLGNVQCLADQKYILVATLPEHISTVSTKSDIHKLFTEEHVQRLFTHDIKAINNCTKSAKNHPLWAELYLEIPFEVPKLPGLSTTANSSMNELATNLENMWKNTLFDYALRRLLLVYFRGRLAPKEGQNYKDLRRCFGRCKQKEAEAKA